MATPMTMLVLVGLAIVLLAGVMLIVWALRQSAAERADLALGTESSCPRCRQANPTYARFCAHCGADLS